MAYSSKYYDPAKAHEYYMKRRQLKGRKKKTSTADLSEAGKIAAQEVKEKLDAELKAALKKLKKGDKAGRAKLKALYAEKYEKELEAIRKDTSMVKQKTPKQSSKGAKSAGKVSSGRSTGAKAQKAENGANIAKSATQKKKPTYADIQKAIADKVNEKVKEIYDRLPNMSEQEKADLKEQLTGFVKRLMAYK